MRNARNGWIESWGQELAAPAQQGSPNCSTGQQCLHRAPGTRLQHARVRSGQCPSVTAAIRAGWKKPSRDIPMKSVDYSHTQSTDFPGGTNCVQWFSYERMWDCCCWLSPFVLRQEVEKGSGTDDQVCANRRWKLKTNQSQKYVEREKRKTFASLCPANPGNFSECVLTSSKSVSYPMMIYPKLQSLGF